MAIEALLRALPVSEIETKTIREWVLNEAGDGIVWERLGLSIASTQLLATSGNFTTTS